MKIQVVYCAGINWCHFQIKIDNEIASFRLHMDDALIWKLFDYLDNQEDITINPTNNSNIKFNFGSNAYKATFNNHNMIKTSFDIHNKNWTWLENIFRKSSKSIDGSVCKYHGVTIFKPIESVELEI